ncbi:hypothetical protein Mapa_002008 [Marchantia paleacea]|nr:hypothetical protein Mapa_002008 [Marchantia paleacea]
MDYHVETFVLQIQIADRILDNCSFKFPSYPREYSLCMTFASSKSIDHMVEPTTDSISTTSTGPLRFEFIRTCEAECAFHPELHVRTS